MLHLKVLSWSNINKQIVSIHSEGYATISCWFTLQLKNNNKKICKKESLKNLKLDRLIGSSISSFI